MKAILDTNIVLDVILPRDEFFDDSYAVLQLAAEGTFDALVPAGAIADIYYIIRKSGKNTLASRNAIASLIQLVSVCDTAASDVSAALLLSITDFEDAILAALAKREKADYIVTRNEHDFAGSPVLAISPRKFLKQVPHL